MTDKLDFSYLLLKEICKSVSATQAYSGTLIYPGMTHSICLEYADNKNLSEYLIKRSFYQENSTVPTFGTLYGLMSFFFNII